MKLGVISFAAAALVGSLWFGTDESYDAVKNAIDQVAKLEAAGPDALKAAIIMRGGSASDPFGMPSMLTVEGSTGVINISGSLVNGSAGFFRFFGMTGYEDIKAAVTEALDDKNVKRILLNIDSPGGAVNGLEDAGDFIRKASAIKPVTSFTGGTMSSAAYWLGISADQVFAARTAMAGSVGTLIVTMEMTDALAKEGRKAHIFRHGEFKALGHPYEKMTKAGEEHFQYLADSAGKIFVSYAADRRGTTPEKFQKTMGEGRVFMGEDAAKVGLIDGIMSFDEVLSTTKSLDKRSRTAENSRHSAQGNDMKLRALSKAVLLAIAGGTKVEALGLSSEAANVEGVKPEAEDVTALTADATEIQSAFQASTTAAVSTAVAAAKADSDKVLASLTSKVTLLEAGASDLTGKVTAANELAASYASVVKASITNMSIALGAADTGAALAGKELMAEHERLKALFVAKFPGASVTAANPGKPVDDTAKTGPSPEFLAAVGTWKRNA